MKKIILTCFLALLCLVGRYLSTLDKVADPPTEEPNHLSAKPSELRSARLPFTFLESGFHVSPSSGDTHRGGETLPDFPSLTQDSDHYQWPKYLEAPYPTYQHYTAVDGGPWSVSRVEPWPVDPRSKGFSLVDNSTSPGQEESAPPAREGEALFYLELPATLASDTLWLTYWEHFLEDNQEATPGTTIPLVAFNGDFFRGNRDYKSYHWSPEHANGPVFFKIRDNRNWLLNTWTILPGDQVRVRKELSNGQTYFLGPAADFFRAQHLISSLAETQKIQAHPLMVTNNTESIFSDSTTQARYQQANALSKTLFPTMLFFSPGSDDNSLTDSLLALPLLENPMIKALPTIISSLSPEQQARVSQQAWGEILSAKLSRVNLNRKILTQTEYRHKYEVWKSAIPDLSTGENLDPLFLKAVYELAILDAFVYDKSLIDILETYPPILKDHILGRYLLGTFRRREGAQASSLQTGLDLIQTPWIREKLLELQTTALPGSIFSPSALTDLSGKPFDLEQFKGKSLVISFWISGCKFCIKYYENTLKPVFDQFADRDDVVFITVNADTNQKFWKEHLATGRYADSTMINLHQDLGTGILEQYQISSFPQKLLIGPDFRLFLLTKTQYSPEQLSQMIDSMAGKNRSYSQSKPK